MDKKQIYRIDLAMVIVMTIAIVGAMGFIGYRTPYVISPQNNLVTTNDTILFSFENGENVLIDDNRNFTSPKRIKVRDDLLISLEPGTYYWRVEGLINTRARRLTVRSKIDLRMEKKNGGYVLTNGGNVGLNVAVYNQSKWERNFTLPRRGEEEVEGTKFIGGQDE